MATQFCDRCGGGLDAAVIRGGTGSDGTAADHDPCRLARELEPPRYCSRCGRRMVVQVTPDGWTARCARHPPVSHLGG